jgi:hypothetical protein
LVAVPALHNAVDSLALAALAAALELAVTLFLPLVA